MQPVMSGEGVALDLDRAGLGSRFIAGILDVLAQCIVLVGLVIIDAEFASGDDAITAALVIVELVLILAGYPIVFEWLSRGRTLGKLALGLRVVRDDGGPIGFRHALVRGLSSFLLEKPGLIFPLGTAVGSGLIAFTESNKRIGDLLAGTFVIRERAPGRNTLAGIEFGVPWPLQPWAQAVDLSRVDDQLAFGIRQFLLRAGQLNPQAAGELGEQFRYQVESVIAPPPPPGVPTPILLQTVLAERRRRAVQAATGY